jgi:RND family efflux transporter MFP subunit
MNIMKLQLNTPVLTLSLALGVLFSSCSRNEEELGAIKKDQPVEVTVGVAARQPGNSIQVSGRVESKETAVISTRVMGFITSVKVKAGDNIKAGQLLATISSADILAKKGQAQAMLSEATAALVDAKKDYERFAQLYEQNSASKKEFENATLHYTSMKAKVEAAQQMENEADAMLAYTNLRAPFSGVVTQKYVDAGSMANPGMPILAIEQKGNYMVTASVSEKDIVRVKEGTVAVVLVKSSGQLIQGTVSEVSPSSQLSGGQFGIKVNFPEGEKSGLYSGMHVNVTIQGAGSGSEGDKILIPSSAIVSNDQLTGLFTITEDQTAMLRWIRLGKTQGDQVEILSGLRNDEKFILTSEGKLYNGVPVRVK